MRIYYINRRLTQYHSAPGLWARQVLFGLRRSGAAVSSYPAIGGPAGATASARAAVSAKSGLSESAPSPSFG